MTKLINQDVIDEIIRLYTEELIGVNRIARRVNLPYTRVRNIILDLGKMRDRKTGHKLWKRQINEHPQIQERHEIRGDETAIFLYRRDGSIIETLIDTTDLPKILELRWSWNARYNRSTKGYYATARDQTTGKTLLLHRLIMDAPDGLMVDHINHNTLDNRKQNLRLAVNSENMQNQNLRSDNKSGVRGVHLDKKSGKWVARVRVNGKQKTLGYFVSIDDADHAVKQARGKYMPFSQDAIKQIAQ